MTTTLEVIPNPPNRFAAKLTFADRCAMFALNHLKNVSQARLAYAFDVHLKTAGFICNQNSKVYKNIHAELHRLGLQGMWDTYVTDDHIRRVNEQPLDYSGLKEPSRIHKAGADEWHQCKYGSFRIIWATFEEQEGWFAEFRSPEQPWMGTNSVRKPFNTATAGVKFWTQELNSD